MDDIQVFQDLIKPKFEIEEIQMQDEDSDKASSEDNRNKSRRESDEVRDNNISTPYEGESHKQNSDVEKNFQFDEDDTKFGIEQLGTLLSAFLQDDSGRNVVDAIVQNSKWQRNICRALEKISDQLAKENSR